MINRRRFNSQTRYFHLNTGLFELAWTDKAMPERWGCFCEALKRFQQGRDFTVHSLVLMNTHFHLLFSTSSSMENILVEELHQLLSAFLNRTYNAWEEPFYCEPILDFEYYKNAYKYIYRNPVEAGLCSLVEDYPFSSAAGILGKTSPTPVVDNLGLIYHPFKILNWLNAP